MKHVSTYYRKTTNWLRKRQNLLLTIFFIFIFFILMTNTFHERYPDEFDNILGGWYMRNGIPIYSGFFTHHGPIAYFLAAFITVFSGNSFVIFRVILSILIFLFLLGSYIYLRKNFAQKAVNFYLLFIFIVSLAGSYYWLHMLLADSISAYFFAPVFTILFLSVLYKRALTILDVILISFLTSFSLLSSLTYTYVAILIYAFTFFYYFRSRADTFISFRSVKILLIFTAPYVAFLLYLLITFSLKDYLYQGITFNQRYYIYNYPRPEGVTAINPLRFAVVIANNFYNSYFPLLQQVKDINFNFPMNITLAVGTFTMSVYLLLKRQYLFALTFIGLIIFSNARSNPLESKETDYQSAVYIILAFLSISFLLFRLYEELNESSLAFGKKVVFTTLFITLVLYSLFSGMFLFQRFFNRFYEKYMGRAPIIYDRPVIAPVINNIIAKNEPVWIGPFEFEELFYIHGKPATRFHVLLPGMGSSPDIQEEFISDLQNSKPNIIWFQKNFFILGRSPEQYGQFFIEYLDKNYITLLDYSHNGNRYISQIPITDKVDIETRMYIRKEAAESIIQKLLSLGYIRERSEF